MSKAIELANSLVSEWHEDQINFDTALNAETELKRLAAIEEKYSAIMALEPYWYAVVSKTHPICNKAIRSLDVAHEYVDKCESNEYWNAGIVPLYKLPKD